MTAPQTNPSFNTKTRATMKRKIYLILLWSLALVLASYFEHRAVWLGHMFIAISGAILWESLQNRGGQ